MTTKKKLNIQWAAGLYEGEGTCYLNRSNGGKYAYPRLQVSSTDTDVLLDFQRVVGGGRINGPYEKIQHDGTRTRDLHRWQADGHEAIRIANRLRPYVNGRRGKQIDAVLRAKHGRQ